MTNKEQVHWIKKIDKLIDSRKKLLQEAEELLVTVKDPNLSSHLSPEERDVVVIELKKFIG